MKTEFQRAKERKKDAKADETRVKEEKEQEGRAKEITQYDRMIPKASAKSTLLSTRLHTPLPTPLHTPLHTRLPTPLHTPTHTHALSSSSSEIDVDSFFIDDEFTQHKEEEKETQKREKEKKEDEEHKEDAHMLPPLHPEHKQGKEGKEEKEDKEAKTENSTKEQKDSFLKPPMPSRELFGTKTKKLSRTISPGKKQRSLHRHLSSKTRKLSKTLSPVKAKSALSVQIPCQLHGQSPTSHSPNTNKSPLPARLPRHSPKKAKNSSLKTARLLRTLSPGKKPSHLSKRAKTKKSSPKKVLSKTLSPGMTTSFVAAPWSKLPGQKRKNKRVFTPL